MIELVKQYDLYDKEDKVSDQQPSRNARGPNAAKNKKEDDDQVDKEVHEQRAKIAEDNNVPDDLVVRVHMDIPHSRQ